MAVVTPRSKRSPRGATWALAAVARSLEFYRRVCHKRGPVAIRRPNRLRLGTDRKLTSAVVYIPRTDRPTRRAFGAAAAGRSSGCGTPTPLWFRTHRSEEVPDESADTQVPRRDHQAGRPRSASPGVCPGTLPDDGRVLQLRHQLLDHLDPDRRGHPVRLRSGLGRPRRKHHRLAARLCLHTVDRSRDGGDRLRLPDRGRAVLLVEPDEE